MNSAGALVVVNDDTPMYRAIYSIACAYANSGTLIESHGNNLEEIAYIFPSVVCQAFSIELFLKFFFYIDHPKIRGKQDFTEHTKPGSHRNSELWDKVQPYYRDKIVHQARMSEQQFRQQLLYIGDDPFVKWRYVHEEHGIHLLQIGRAHV